MYCAGELSVISTPDSVLFKAGDSKLKCTALGPMMSACLGKSILESSDFNNVYITDPFNVPRAVVLMSATGGSKLNYQPLKTTSYSVTGNGCFPSIASAMERIKEDGSTVLPLDSSNGPQIVRISLFFVPFRLF